MANDLIAIVGLLVCVCFVGALSQVDWQLALTGDPSPIETETRGENLAFLLNVTSLDWGDINPGSTTSRKILCNNTGLNEFSFHLEHGEISPANASQFFEVYLREEGSRISPGESLVCEILLVVDQNITGVKSFTIPLLFYVEGD